MSQDRLPPPTRIVFILTELTIGGAEIMLWKLLSRMDRARFAPHVLALSPRTDAMLELFRKIGIPCELLGMEATLRGICSLFRLRRVLRRLKPDIVQGWLYHGNVAATVSTLFWDNAPPVLWNIRGNLARGKRVTNLLVWLSAKISFLPYKIINNSMASALEHEQRLGFRPDKRLVLPNGFDTEVFRPSASARRAVRQSLGIPDSAILVGLLGRYHPIKDHANFLAAAGIVRATHPEVHFLLAGEGVDEANRVLRDLKSQHDLDDHAHLLGLRDDVPNLMCSLDILVCASWGEGFPNVVGEAMSCAVPCVVTDVGDSRAIVADTGRTVPPRDSGALARGILELIEMGPEGRAYLGLRARQRVVEHFSLEAVVRQYEDLYLQVREESLAQQRT